ncbi:alpha/beta fold hydrolase [Helicobacter pametensis]|uniref:alpha/beta fold hydrolase n=1 Tax=Helicobacter pametensis TaxID=95149 RepID=UPI0004889ABB|nr:alpha/beta fold hydrolase [Helicobacter pametensis]
MQQKEDLRFKSDFGEIDSVLYLPKIPNGVIVQIAHGMIEEKDKYDEFAQFLASSGFVVAISDHRGHGKSIGGKSGEYEVRLGEMGEDGFERAAGDLLVLTQILKNRFCGFKFILLGHSMGSLLARRYLQLYEDELDGLILMGTPSPNVFAGFGARICRMFEVLGWNQTGVYLMNKLSLISFNQKFQKQDKQAPSYAWLTRDLDRIQPYMLREDYHFSFTLNSFRELFNGLKQVFSSYPKVCNPALPILFLSGDDDPCGEFGYGVQKAYKHLISQGYHNVQMRLYSGARHELLLELNNQQVMQEIREWMIWSCPQ